MRDFSSCGSVSLFRKWNVSIWLQEQGMTAVELEAVVCHEPDQSELSRFSDNGSKNLVYQLLDQKSSERRWLSER